MPRSVSPDTPAARTGPVAPPAEPAPARAAPGGPADRDAATAAAGPAAPGAARSGAAPDGSDAPTGPADSTDPADNPPEPPDLAALAAVPLLAGLPAARLRALLAAAVPRRYAAGEVLRAAGEPAGQLLLLLAGRVAATVATAAGREVRVGAWSGPCALDKVAVVDGRGHTATLTALTPCTVRALPRDAFLALVDDAADVRAHVLHVLAAQAREQQDRFTDAATLPTAARLAAWLLAEAARRRARRVPLPGGQQALADQLGVTRVTLNRALSGLRREGLVAYRRGEVELLSPELLALRASPAG